MHGGLARQLEKKLLVDENAGFLNNDTLSIKITMRVLKDSEFREYQSTRGKKDKASWRSDMLRLPDLVLKVATWKHLRQYEEADLLDWKNVPTIPVSKTITIEQLKKTIRETADLHAENLRLWPCGKRKNQTIRPEIVDSSGDCNPTRIPEDARLFQVNPYSRGNIGQACDGVKIYVEELQPGDKSSGKIDDTDALIFFKFWDPKGRRLRYIGHLIFKRTTRVKSMVEAARSAFLPEYAFDDIQALEELKPDKIEDLVYVVTDKFPGIERDAQLQDQQVELQSGDIIVIQPENVAGTADCVKMHYDLLLNKVLVSFRSKTDPQKEVFEMQLHGSLDYDTICDKVAQRLSEIIAFQPAQGKRIQLWTHSREAGGPSCPIAKVQQTVMLRSLVTMPTDGSGKGILYYEEMQPSLEILPETLLRVFPLQSSEVLVRHACGGGAGSCLSVRAGETFEIAVAIKDRFGPFTDAVAEHMARQLVLLPQDALDKQGEVRFSSETGVAAFPVMVKKTGQLTVSAAVIYKGTA